MALFGIGKKGQESLTPEELERKISRLQKELDSVENKLNSKKDELNQTKAQVDNLKGQITSLQGMLSYEIEMQEYGLYHPTFVFSNSDLYKDKLTAVRDQQKQMIKLGTACTGNMNWTVNGSKSQGNKMVKDMQKLLLRAFNVECDEIIDNVTIANVDRSRERIQKSAQQISKLGTIMSIMINAGYVRLKQDELNLALDFAQKKQEEKERLRELREQQREEAKAQKEIAEKRAKLEKERAHYQNALESLRNKLAADPNNADLLAKQRELETELSETDKAIADVDYRQANIKAGYVYIISNIGAFGRDIYKIGMTRRLEPLDRVEELGGASVPFQFDVHALIFTEDAPSLEAALHRAFEKQKVNKVNPRREFFHVSLEQIKRVVRENYDKTVEWIDIPPAEQFRQSLLIGKTDAPAQIDRTVPQLTTPMDSVSVSTPKKTSQAPSTPVPVAPSPVFTPKETLQAPITPGPAAAPLPIASPPLQSIAPKTTADAIKVVAQQGIPGCRIQDEDSPDMQKIHIYYPDNRKFGIVKISKKDGTMQLRKLAGGTPINYDLAFANDLKQYLL